MHTIDNQSPFRHIRTPFTRKPVPFRLNNFDLIRLLAALQVLFFHCMDRLRLDASPWSNPLELFSGVPIFFVASGFMVSASYERQQGNWRKYFSNRAMRIFPGLWACIGLTVVVVLLLGFRPQSLSDSVWLPAQLAGAIHTPSFLQGFGTGTYNGALWTIPVELQFYLALPLAYLAAFRQRSNRSLAFVFILSVLVSLLLAHWYPVVYGHAQSRMNKIVNYSFLPNFYLFMYGVMLQRCRAYEFRVIAGKAVYWAALLIAFHYVQPNWPSANLFGLLLLATTAISAAYTVPSLSTYMKGVDLSYGVYIYHGLVINMLVSAGFVGHWQAFFLLLLLTGVAATCSWHFVERPVLRRKQHRISPMQEPAL